MPKLAKTIITYLLTFGLCGFLLWLSVKNLTSEQIHSIREAISKANFVLIIPIVVMGILSHWSRAKRWRYLMQPLGYKPSTANTMFAIMIGYFANLVLPRFGEVLKCTILARYEKVPADKLVGTIITERAFDVLCLLIVFAITFLIQIDFSIGYLESLWSRSQQNSSGHQTLYVVLGIFAVLLFVFFLLRKRIAHSAFFQKIKGIFSNIWSGIMSFRTMENKAGFVFHTIFIWAMYFGMILIGFQCLEATQGLGIKPSFSVLSFGSVGMIVTPGGIGAYILIVNEIVQLYGIDEIHSNAVSWIVWLVPTAILVAGGAISLLLLPLYNKERKNA
jgi:glycosyltransferase 2 family protein